MATRRVTMHRTSAGEPYLRRGREYSLPPGEAKRLVGQGIAAYVDGGADDSAETATAPGGAETAVAEPKSPRKPPTLDPRTRGRKAKR